MLVSFHSDSSIHLSMENVLRVNQEHTPEVDLLAKKALNHTQIEIKLAISKAEFKRVISVEVNKKWQKLWNSLKEDIFFRFRSMLEMREKDMEIGRKMSLFQD